MLLSSDCNSAVANCKSPCIFITLTTVTKTKVICCEGRESFQQTNHCNALAHRRASGKPGLCLPHYRPSGEVLKLWNERDESKFIHLCMECDYFQTGENQDENYTKLHVDDGVVIADDSQLTRR